MKKTKLVLLILVVAVLSGSFGAYAATTFGTQSDPLVTVSYLTDTLTPTINSEIESSISKAIESMEYSFSNEIANATGTYELVTLSSGQTLVGNAGCEVLFRDGTAKAVGTLVDVSSGGAVSANSSLTKNHLYLCSDEDDGLVASTAVTLLVRGTYTIV